MRVTRICVIATVWLAMLPARAGTDDNLLHPQPDWIRVQLIEMAGSHVSDLSPEVHTAVEELAWAYYNVVLAPENSFWRDVLLLNLALTAYLVDHSQIEAPSQQKFLSSFFHWSANVLPGTTRTIAAQLVNRDLAFAYLQEINHKLKLIGDGSPPPEQVIQFQKLNWADGIKMQIAGLLAVALTGGGSQLLGEGGELNNSALAAMSAGLAILALAVRYWINVEKRAEPKASIEVVGRYFSRAAETPCEILIGGRHIESGQKAGQE